MNDTLVGRRSAGSDTETHRSPWQVRTLAAIVTLLTLVTSYGAIYFSYFFEDPEPGLGTWVFVTVFLGINVTAAAAVRGLVHGRLVARQVLVGYTVLGMLWCVAKLVFWQETESLVFGVLDLVSRALRLPPRPPPHPGG
jgi:hypothetical protein